MSEVALLKLVDEYRDMFQRRGELLLSAKCVLHEAECLQKLLDPLKAKIDELMLRETRHVASAAGGCDMSAGTPAGSSMRQEPKSEDDKGDK